MLDKAERLEDLRERTLGCTRCTLHRSRNRAVPGEGNPDADLVLVGQGPGRNEDALGRPFVGRAGDILNKLLGEVGIKREDIWITNVTRCLPPDDRLPSASEIKTCAPYLVEEMDIVKPLVVSPLGNIALQIFVEKSTKIQQVRGSPIPKRTYFLFPMLHPAGVLRRPDLLPIAKHDFVSLKEFIDSKPVLTPPPGQESFF
ncbi:MAG: uracil-DNA glycosylase family protein [Candidatus Binatia bacterium]